MHYFNPYRHIRCSYCCCDFRLGRALLAHDDPQAKEYSTAPQSLFCKYMLGSTSSKRFACPECKLRLSNLEISKASLSKTIVVVGPPNTGKSTYVAMLVDSLLGNDGYKFSRSIGLQTYDPRSEEYVASTQMVQLRYGRLFTAPNSHGEVDLLEATRPDDSRLTVPLRYMIEASNASFIINIMDSAGELYGNLRGLQFSTHLKRVDAFIILLDPDAFQQNLFGMQGRDKNMGIHRIICETMLANWEDAQKLPAAFVVHKFDKLKTMGVLPGGITQAFLNQKGALIENYVESISTKLEEWVRQHNQSDGIFDFFDNRAFFPVSSLGSTPVTRGGSAFLKGPPKPYGNTHPIAWLLTQFSKK